MSPGGLNPPLGPASCVRASPATLGTQPGDERGTLLRL